MHILTPRQRPLIALVLMLAAIGWIAFTVRDSIDRLPASLGALQLAHIVSAGMPAVASVLIAAYMYFLVLSGIVPLTASLRTVVLPFLVAQAVRHLPGKIWGIVYLAQATTGLVAPRHAVKANIVHFSLTTLYSLAAAASVYVFYRTGAAPALMTYAVLLLILYLVLRSDLLQRSASLIMRDHEYQRSRTRKDLAFLGLLQADWLFYVMVCALLLPAPFALGDSLIIAALYSVAWLAGALAVMLPGGLFVREGAFLWLSGLFGYDAADIFLFSLVARILLTLIDVACAVLGMVLMRKEKERSVRP